jgi:hypothetical protein
MCTVRSSVEYPIFLLLYKGRTIITIIHVETNVPKIRNIQPRIIKSIISNVSPRIIKVTPSPTNRKIELNMILRHFICQFVIITYFLIYLQNCIVFCSRNLEPDDVVKTAVEDVHWRNPIKFAIWNLHNIIFSGTWSIKSYLARLFEEKKWSYCRHCDARASASGSVKF